MNNLKVKSMVILKLTALLITISLISCDEGPKDRTDMVHNLEKQISESIEEWKLYTEDGCEVFVREMGQGEGIVILHGGWGAEHSYLIDGFKNLSKDHHLIFYDQRGSLRSPCKGDSAITVRNHVEDLERLRNELKLKRLIIIGHSMGGLLAMNYIDHYPNKVKGLILLAAPPAIGTVKGFIGDESKVLERWDRPEVIETLKKYGLNRELKPEYSDKQRGLWHSITFAAINLHDIRNWKKMKGEFYYNQEAGVQAARSMGESWDFTSQLDSLDIPIYVVHGDDDFIPLSKHQEWTIDVENVELKVVPKAGHLNWIDQPEAINKLIQEYLKKING